METTERGHALAQLAKDLESAGLGGIKEKVKIKANRQDIARLSQLIKRREAASDVLADSKDQISKWIEQHRKA